MDTKTADMAGISASGNAGPVQREVQLSQRKPNSNVEPDMTLQPETETDLSEAELRKKRREAYAKNLVYKPRKAARNVLTRMEGMRNWIVHYISS